MKKYFEHLARLLSKKDGLTFFNTAGNAFSPEVTLTNIYRTAIIPVENQMEKQIHGLTHSPMILKIIIAGLNGGFSAFAKFFLSLGQNSKNCVPLSCFHDVESVW